MAKCEVCEKEFKNDRGLHAHLKAHKLKVKDYYHNNFPRKDLHTNEFIKFKNKEQYLESDFNNKISMRKWLNDQPENDAKEYVKNILIKRKKKKNLKFLPSQIELRTIIAPPIQYYNKLFKNYYSICDELGFDNKFKFLPKEKVVSGSTFDYDEYSILVDTREQKPLDFNFFIEVATLPFGDYAFSDQESSCKCFIERKSLNDFIGTMSGGYERLKEEIERALIEECYLIILVERNLNDCKSFNYLTEVKKKMPTLKATPEYIFFNVRELMQTYKTLQFLFVEDRKEASRVIEKIFTSGCVFKDIDLQYTYDSKLL